MVRPMVDLPLYLADMATWSSRWGRARRWLSDNKAFRARVLKQLRASGPLQSRDIADTCAVPWESSGWTHDRNVTQMLEFLASMGEVADRRPPGSPAAVGRGRARVSERRRRGARSRGEAHPRRAPTPVARHRPPGGRGRGWRARRDRRRAGRVASPPRRDRRGVRRSHRPAVSPFDRLVHDRSRAVDLFDFEYTLEMYKPAAKRRWGYFALPVLHHDRLVGKVDAIADRKTARLDVHAIHEDVRFTKTDDQGCRKPRSTRSAAWLELSRR